MAGRRFHHSKIMFGLCALLLVLTDFAIVCEGGKTCPKMDRRNRKFIKKLKEIRDSFIDHRLVGLKKIEMNYTGPLTDGDTSSLHILKQNVQKHEWDAKCIPSLCAVGYRIGGDHRRYLFTNFAKSAYQKVFLHSANLAQGVLGWELIRGRRS
ncbi:unnamed protein product [Cylicocyclus nassatus]|uniref:Uncharacterized protein n=1 Tax=Cylicocyclus nassatus TaxID=53992 RepID=A0AA36DRJ9_CYLNA|nr:unnamed protein product [Cylicocyclus nassatus]